MCCVLRSATGGSWAFRQFAAHPLSVDNRPYGPPHPPRILASRHGAADCPGRRRAPTPHTRRRGPQPSRAGFVAKTRECAIAACPSSKMRLTTKARVSNGSGGSVSGDLQIEICGMQQCVTSLLRPSRGSCRSGLLPQLAAPTILSQVPDLSCLVAGELKAPAVAPSAQPNPKEPGPLSKVPRCLEICHRLK
jgi:hypothetical protein